VQPGGSLFFDGYVDNNNGSYSPFTVGPRSPTNGCYLDNLGTVEFKPDAYYKLMLGASNECLFYIDGADSSDETIAWFAGSYNNATRSYYQDTTVVSFTVLGQGSGAGGARLQCDQGFYQSKGTFRVKGSYENNLVCGTGDNQQAYFAGGGIHLELS